MEPCPFCNEQMEFATVAPDLVRVTCPRCCEYLIVATAKALLKSNPLTDRQKANISGWLNENRGHTIYSYSLDTLRNIKTPNFEERADKILLNLEKITEYAGEYKPMDESWIS